MERAFFRVKTVYMAREYHFVVQIGSSIPYAQFGANSLFPLRPPVTDKSRRRPPARSEPLYNVIIHVKHLLEFFN